MATYLGCDPGANGAVCILSPLEQTISFFETPGGKTPPGSLFADFMIFVPYIDAAAIEDVHSLHGMSAKSNFSFGYNVGAVTEAIESFLQIQEIPGTAPKPLLRVQPKVWQKAVGITAKGPAIKQAVADKALELYPGAEIYGPKGGLRDGRADALMIAHYVYITQE